MMKDSLKISEKFPADVKELYMGWLDSKIHSEFTGGQKTKIDSGVGGKFSAWDGYIFGKTLELEPYKRILQAWRTTEFPVNAPDSILELLFEPIKGGTRLTIIHQKLPPDQVDDYLQGWKDFYFEPMREYFARKVKL
jgi:activator of HSP90 ATPase